MSELTFNILKTAFKAQSLTEKDHLNYDELYIVISKLNTSAFDEETYEQIWDQCKLNSKGEVRISDFMDYLIKAEELLIEKQQENANEIGRKENEMKGKTADFTEQRVHNEQMDALMGEREAIKNSLTIIRKPFIVPVELILNQVLPKSMQNIHQQQEQIIRQNDIVNQLFEYDSADTPAALSNIFYLTAVLVFLTWLASFFICQFLNLIVYTCILSQFSFQIISRKLIKFNLLLLCFCTVFDILWLIIQTSKIWYLPSNYELAQMTSNYLKFSIVLLILCLCIRVVLVFYYLSQFHIDEFQIYPVRLLGKDLNIQRETEPFTPNRNALSLFLQPYFNKSPAEGEQVQ